MKRAAAVLMVAVVLGGLAATAAYAQYYTPLRYDLRYSNPRYIPSGVMRFGPQRSDPYRFGSPRYSNLSITGNLRLGKSFRGSTPYVATGGQLTNRLPSDTLSNFRRDSMGVEDIGSGLEYGGTQPYFSETSSVTSAWNAGNRFDESRFGNRSRYLPPNFNTAYAGPPPAAPSIYTASGGWTGVFPDPLELAARIETGTPGYSIPFLQSGIAGNGSIPVLGLPEHDAAGGEDATDAIASPYDFFRKQFDQNPANVLDPADDPGGALSMDEGPIEKSLQLQYAGKTEAADAWVVPDPRDVPTAGDFSFDDTDTGADPLAPPDDDPADAQGPDGGNAGGPEADRPVVQSGDVPVAVSGYGHFVLRGHQAIKAGQYATAESYYAAAVALGQDRPAAFFGRVHALMGARMYLQAANVLQTGFKKHPDWVRHALDMRAVYPQADVYGRIVRELRNEADRGMGRGQYDFLLGYVQFASGQKEEARKRLSGPAGEDKARKAILDAIGAN